LPPSTDRGSVFQSKPEGQRKRYPSIARTDRDHFVFGQLMVGIPGTKLIELFLTSNASIEALKMTSLAAFLI
jgi:hypothetical protein